MSKTHAVAVSRSSKGQYCRLLQYSIACALVVLLTASDGYASAEHIEALPQTRSAVDQTFDSDGPFDHAELVKETGGGEQALDDDELYDGIGEPDAGQEAGAEGRGIFPPDNDDCDDATIIPGNVIIYNPATYWTGGATTVGCEGDESCGSTLGNSNSVWYTYTPDHDGTITVDTIGSSYNTVLSIFDRCAIFAPPYCLLPNELACNNDLIFGGLQSQISNFPVTAGEDYLFKVSDQGGQDGGGSLNFNMRWFPANDHCSSATEINGVVYNPTPFSTTTATTEGCEAQESCEWAGSGVSNSVWYSYTPPCDGTLSINTNQSTYDTVLSIFDGCGELVGPDLPCVIPNEIDCDDDDGTGLASQLIDVPVLGGVEYLIKVADYNTSSGGGMLHFHFMFSGATPPVTEITSPGTFECVCDLTSVQGTAMSPDGGFGGYELEYATVDGESWTLLASSADEVINGELGSFPTAGLSQGYYMLRLTAQSACGLTGTAIKVVWVNTDFDTVDVSMPADEAVVGGQVCFDGTVWDNACFDHYTVDYRPEGGGSWVPVDSGSPTYTSAVINDPFATWATDPDIADGTYTVRVTGTDDCGNTKSEQRNVVVDNTPPTATIAGPLSCQYVDGEVEVFGTADDLNLARWSLQYTGGPSSGWTEIASGTDGVFNDLLGIWNTESLPACAYTLRLLVRDNSILNCNGAINHVSEHTVSVNVGSCGDFDSDDDGDVDLFDYGEFQAAFTGAMP